MNVKEQIQKGVDTAEVLCQELGARNKKSDASRLAEIIKLAKACLGDGVKEGLAEEQLGHLRSGIKIAEGQVVTESYAIREATGTMGVERREDGCFPIQIIEAGFGNARDKAYYGADMLATPANYQIFEGCKMYLDHLTSAGEKALEGGPRSVRDWAATIKETFWDPATSTVKGWAKPVTEAFSSTVDLMGEDLGISIDAFAQVIPGIREGKRVNVIQRFTHCASVDLVTEAGAGGHVLQVMEGRFVEATSDGADTLAAKMNKVRRTVQAAFEHNGKGWVYCEGIWDDHVIFDQCDQLYWVDYHWSGDAVILADNIETVDKIITYVTTGQIACPSCGAGHSIEGQPTIESTKGGASTMPLDEATEKRLTEMGTQITDLGKTVKEQATTIGVLETDKAVSAREGAIMALLADSGLPDPSKSRLASYMKERSFMDDAAMKEAVEAEVATEKAYIQKLAPGAVVTESGGMETPDGTSVKESVGKELDDLLGVEKPAKEAATA